ncbi:12942_t:CDS:2 [Racocetra fulgida]|uniref:12942_t:CDS:1 n=1 Tax=Racocetra fulgida TaxID=60492 RepID=A0A9N9CIH8_9GLOM|nr:12942_t:CDS:2 [Racocetra fulgida]
MSQEECSMKSDENKKKRKIDDNNVHLGGEYEVNNSTVDNIADGFQVVGEAAQPFLQFFQSVTTIVDSIMKAYKNGKCNQKICLALIDRVEIAQQAVKSLERQQMENEELFEKQDYYNAWVRFIVVLENINKFVKEVTQLSNLQKFLTANAVKEAFDKNIKEFEEVCRDLNFTLAIYDINKKDLENKRIMEDINALTKNMNDSFSEHKKELKKELAQLSEKFDQLMKKTTFVDPTLIEAYREPEINPRELAPVPSENDSGKTILQRNYRGVKVACKKILVEKNDIKSCAEFAILQKMLLDPSPIAQELFKIIKQAWQHNPSERPKVMNVLTTLQEAYEKYVPKGASPMILPKNISDNNIPIYNLEGNKNKCDTRKFPEDCKSEPIDREKAKHYARLAALKNYSKAIELLKKLNAVPDIDMSDA